MRLAIALLLSVRLAAAAVDPAAALARAKSEIEAGDNGAALQHLRAAIPAAAALTNQQHRTAALSAIHFYSALAETNLGQPDQARNDLRSFFLYSPGAKVDTPRYPAAFVDLFDEVAQNIRRSRANPASFDDAYPGYPIAVSSSAWPVDSWGASSEFQILATEEEKEQWGRLADTEQRRKFIDEFWALRDPDPATGMNEARIEFLQRIAFADVAFIEAVDDRGSLSDRGRIFVLLGPPKRVTIRPMDRREAPYAPRRTIDAGNAMEQWTYFREQLPRKLPNNEVTFRFISEGGMLNRKMQRDFLAEKVFRDSPGALRR
jgi:GWxTD domain-containing protein